jgi:hypothetical protein
LEQLDAMVFEFQTEKERDYYGTIYAARDDNVRGIRKVGGKFSKDNEEFDKMGQSVSSSKSSSGVEGTNPNRLGGDGGNQVGGGGGNESGDGNAGKVGENAGPGYRLGGGDEE